ncbi:helix-turn-helix domain-containing protein [Oliverpabstia intestinalis]|uniref:helix-turn-helix domain-containing protein n=1 Tax=Oliverpabstia intestinalis TaxID=2606633 RepID=UPI003F96B862
MRKLLKSFKTEINPTVEQKIKINKTIGTCRYVYNFYLDHNKTLHDNGEKFMTGKSFSVWLNNEYIPNNPDKICHCCGAIKKDLKLSDRIYRCNCGYVEDRDFNAALNLRDALTYEVA